MYAYICKVIYMIFFKRLSSAYMSLCALNAAFSATDSQICRAICQCARMCSLTYTHTPTYMFSFVCISFVRLCVYTFFPSRAPNIVILLSSSIEIPRLHSRSHSQRGRIKNVCHCVETLRKHIATANCPDC